jgi:hypothetical protein
MGSLRLHQSNSCTWILMITDFDDAISGMIEKISEIPNEDLINMSRIVERAYIHILVEQGLRVKVDSCSVSRIA